MSIIDKLNTIFSGEVDNPERGYLGMSMIGDSCPRKLQYSMYLVSPVARISRRIERLFNDGHLFEEKLVEILAKAGFEIYGRQISLKSFNNFWSGHIDGLMDYLGETYLVEMKTHNDKNFKLVVKQGVKKAKPAHYDQMQMYMGYGNWKQCIYFAYNKNDSDIHSELVEFNEAHFERLEKKSADIIIATDLFPRIGNNSPTWYECKFCNVSGVCFGKIEVDKNCRTCAHVEPGNGNTWDCNFHKVNELDYDRQLLGCEHHELHARFHETS